MLAAFQQAVDAAFAAFGVRATYKPQAGGQKFVTVIPRRPDQSVSNFSETSVYTQTTAFDVRAADITHPREGDQLVFDEVTYIIQGEPRRDDPRRLVWSLDTRPA